MLHLYYIYRCYILFLTKSQNWVEWTVASVSFFSTKRNDINFNDGSQIQNDTESAF